MIVWIHRDVAMIENTLLHIDEEIAWKIACSPSGQQAINTLFRDVQRQLINRAAIVTAAQQVDHGKRIRDARSQLAPEGILILGHYRPHPQIAEQLGLPRPTLGRFVSARVTRQESEEEGGFVTIGGERWRLANADDPAVHAPRLPSQGRTTDP